MTGDIAEDLSHMLSLSVTENATLRADIAAAREEIGRLQPLADATVRQALTIMKLRTLLREARNTRAPDYVPGDWAMRVDAALAGGESDVSV